MYILYIHLILHLRKITELITPVSMYIELFVCIYVCVALPFEETVAFGVDYKWARSETRFPFRLRIPVYDANLNLLLISRRFVHRAL